MTTGTRTHSGSRFFWGWVIAIAGFAVTMTVGETLFSFGLFLKPLESEFGWSRALTSTAYSAFLVGYSISVVTAGRLSDRHNPRTVLLFCAVLAGGGMALSGLATDINHLRAFLFISGLGSGGTWSVPAAAVQKWFHNKPRSGLALSVVASGAAAGMVVYPPLINYLISAHGWRSAYLVVGAILLCVTATGALLIGRRPEPSDTESPGARSGAPQVPLRKLILNGVFIRVALCTMVGTVTYQAIAAHLVPFATDEGISTTTATYGLSLLGFFSMPARILSGMAADRFGWRRVFGVSFLVLAACLVSLMVFKGTAGFFVFVAVFGFFHGVRVLGQTGIVAEIFGTASLGLLIGASSGIAQFAAGASPALAGLVYDQTGSYYIAFAILAVMSLAASFTVFNLGKTSAESRLVEEKT